MGFDGADVDCHLPMDTIHRSRVEVRNGNGRRSSSQQQLTSHDDSSQIGVTESEVTTKSQVTAIIVTVSGQFLFQYRNYSESTRFRDTGRCAE